MFLSPPREELGLFHLQSHKFLCILCRISGRLSREANWRVSACSSSANFDCDRFVVGQLRPLFCASSTNVGVFDFNVATECGARHFEGLGASNGGAPRRVVGPEGVGGPKIRVFPFPPEISIHSCRSRGRSKHSLFLLKAPALPSFSSCASPSFSSLRMLQTEGSGRATASLVCRPTFRANVFGTLAHLSLGTQLELRLYNEDLCPSHDNGFLCTCTPIFLPAGTCRTRHPPPEVWNSPCSLSPSPEARCTQEAIQRNGGWANPLLEIQPNMLLLPDGVVHTKHSTFHEQ